MAADSVVATPAARRAMIRERQRDLYGTTLRTLVNQLTEDYGISQARLADTIGISRPMLSQLVSARRIKIGDMRAHTRLMILDQRRDMARELTERSEVDAILADVAQVQQPWPLCTCNRDGWSDGSPTSLLRGVASTMQLAAAAERLEDEFPRIAGLLRRAADDGG
ncbi:XRE family transcriptional regulator [Pseudonocardia sp.]|uniref:XRE family transcriptional regulator n=1 Tax=Pseudonocardia sp. TaxID=60912 RepID=UPI003D13C4DD